LSKFLSPPKLSFFPEMRIKEFSKSTKLGSDSKTKDSQGSASKNLIFPDGNSTATFKNREQVQENLDSIENFRRDNIQNVEEKLEA
jgi:hypothetical protein